MKRLNILIIGSANSFTNQLIRQFNKEGHRVSVLTGTSQGTQKYVKVFERYEFTYTSEVIPEVFSSVSPDVTVFMGAYDGNFSWENERNDSVLYICAIMNILSAYSAAQYGRFIYLSSDTVFQPDNDICYSEDAQLSASDLRSTAFVQAEDICRQFMADLDNDIVIARIAGYYHLPKTPSDVDDFFSEFCISFLESGKVYLPDNKIVMPLSESDAVFFLSRIALAPSHSSSVYHISSGNQIQLAQLKEMITEAGKLCGYDIPDGKPAKPVATRGGKLWTKAKNFVQRKADANLRQKDSSRSKTHFVHLRFSQALLDAGRYRDEFGINRLTDFGEDIRRIVAHIIKNKNKFFHAGPGNKSSLDILKDELIWLCHIIFPFAENILCSIGFLWLNNSSFGSKYFGKIDFMLIYVLLFAILYGQQQAVLSAFLSTAGFLFIQFSRSPNSGIMLDFNTYVWIAQLFILGLTVGYLKDRLSDQKAVALHDYEHMTQQIEDVRDINESNVRVKDALQTQIINQNDSIGKIYQITSTLDRYDSEEVFFQAMDVLRQIMGSDDIALYTVSNSAYARLFSATTEAAGLLGNSIRYKELGELYESIKDGKPYINRGLEDNRPMMACAIRENDEIRTIIMIWKLPWEKMTLGQSSILTVTSMLIQNAVLRAHRFLDIIHNERFIEDTKILRAEAFSTILDTYKKAESQRLTRFTLLRIISGGDDSVIDTGNSAASHLRQDDHLGLGTDGNLYVLLPNTSPKNAEFVINRLNSCSIKAVVSDNINKGAKL